MRIICLLFFLFTHLCMFGQHEHYEQMLHKPYKDIRQGLVEMGDYVWIEADSTSSIAFINEFKTWAELHNDTRLTLEAEFLRVFYYWKFAKGDQEKRDYIKVVAEKAKEEKILDIEARVVMTNAISYWDSQEYQKSFEWFMRAARILDKLDAEDFPDMANFLNYIGGSYYYFRDYQSALVYYERASLIKITPITYLNVHSARNTLGLCYQNMGQYELSNKWFTKVIEDTSEYQSPVWKGIASGNLGYNYYLQGKHDEAIPLLKTDVEYAIDEKIGEIDYGLAAGSTIPLADIYLKRNQLEKSKQEIDAAREYIRLSEQNDRLRKLYPVMSRWFARSNQIDSSEAYLDSAIVADKKYNEKFNSSLLLRASQDFQAKEKELEVAQLKAESELKLTKRNLMSAITVLLLIGSLLAFWFRNKYLVKKQQIKDLALVNTREALTNAKSQLQNLVQRVNQNNEMIIQLQKGKPEREEDLDLLERLKSTSILTQDDWSKFQEMFIKIYPNFLAKLESLYPDLSPAEKRCLCLEKLQMSNNEMALMLGVSANTVIVTKHRIRKKLELETQKELTGFIEELSLVQALP